MPRKNPSFTKKSLLILVAIFATISGATTAILFFINPKITGIDSSSSAQDFSETSTPENTTLEASEVSNDTVTSTPEKIDFQSVVDTWAASVSGNRSVIIYDLDLDETVGSYNTEEPYLTASLYKLFVVYEGYRRLESGSWDGTAAAGSTGYTISKCLDLAIRESYSPCAETLWAMIGHAELDSIIKDDFGITGSNISGLLSNPTDILSIMKLFYTHPHFSSDSLVSAMKDSFLNQPVTTYDWRRGLPSGFSSSVNVYNKVGWDYNGDGGYWNIYHDAAIVEFPSENRHYIVVVMTNYVNNTDIRRLGSAIEAHFNSSIENSD